MPSSESPNARPDYGLDAPGVVRNLFLAGCLGLLIAAGALLHLLPRELDWTPTASLDFRFPLVPIGLWPGLSLTLTGCWMIWTSRVGKLRYRERLLDQLTWTGREEVLDIGCGRGLFMIGAAKRLGTGTATGIDIWRTEDLSGNRPQATHANAVAEGVADRVRIETADMRQLPFPGHAFDVALSCAAIHNLDLAADRAQAIAEIARVLKPGGFALIDDIRHIAQYREEFARHGCRIVRRLDNRAGSVFWTVLTWGSLRPGVLLVQKGVAA